MATEKQLLTPGLRTTIAKQQEVIPLSRLESAISILLVVLRRIFLKALDSLDCTTGGSLSGSRRLVQLTRRGGGGRRGGGARKVDWTTIEKRL